MAASNSGASVPIRIELVSDSSVEAGASRIPGAVAAAAIAPGAVATLFAADDGEMSVYNDPAVLRAGGSGQTYAGVSTPAPEFDLSGSFDIGDAAGDGE